MKLNKKHAIGPAQCAPCTSAKCVQPCMPQKEAQPKEWCCHGRGSRWAGSSGGHTNKRSHN